MEIKRVAAIHDLSGFGRCSLTAAIPILSILNVQPCPMPTAVLSCQTGFSHFSFLDLTDEMKNIHTSWKKEGFKFHGIYTGFLGSKHQVDIVIDIIKDNKDAKIFVDPVMGDGGEVYKIYDNEMCNKIIKLVKHADVVTPNLTEACLITNREYSKVDIDENSLLEIAKDITGMGPEQIIITGIIGDNKIGNFSYDKNTKEYYYIDVPYNNESYSGTGDVFTSIICGMLINNYDLKSAVDKATDFIYKVVKYSLNQDCNPKNGVIFEPLLKELIL